MLILRVHKFRRVSLTLKLNFTNNITKLFLQLDGPMESLYVQEVFGTMSATTDNQRRKADVQYFHAQIPLLDAGGSYIQCMVVLWQNSSELEAFHRAIEGKQFAGAELRVILSQTSFRNSTVWSLGNFSVLRCNSTSLNRLRSRDILILKVFPQWTVDYCPNKQNLNKETRRFN